MDERFAIATVVARAAPVSSHLGDRAVVHADGRMEGFIGGACSRDIVRRQALAALRTGRPRLVRIRPDAARSIEEDDAVTVPMTCISEGAVDVYIEPHVPKRRLLIAGFTPVSDALARLGEALDFATVRFVDEDELSDAQDGPTEVLPVHALQSYLDSLDPQLCAQGAGLAVSQGHYDEAALRAFLSRDLPFVGLLASPKRAAAVTQLLADEGVAQDRLARLHAPLGIAIGARKPAEVAVSILAEIIAASSDMPELAAEPQPAEQHSCCAHHAPAPSA
jgi:xanthine dehydrogenase accessory factor